MGLKKSKFTTDTVIPAGATFDFVSNGQNFKILAADLLSALGVTGTLTQSGAVTGTPVLDIDAANYQIRNIEDGNGVISSVSPENGITVSWNVSQDTTGVALTSGLGNTVPAISSLVAGTGISITKDVDAITLINTVDPASGLSNRVVVTQASDLSGVLDSTKEYFIDGVVDMGSQTISIPAGGLSLAGYSFDNSKLTSSAGGYSMFVSPIGGSGNVIGRDYALEVTGAGSQVYDLVSATGFDAFEFTRINYNDCTSLGTIDGYRQGLEVGTGRFGGRPELTLAGTWVGGYFIDTSIVRSLTNDVYTLFKAGAGFTMASRFRTNQNIDLPAAASFFDFAPSNFTNPSTLQVNGAIVTRNGVFDSTDSNITPNITETDLASSWHSNVGMPNTFEGGSIGVTTESVTTIVGIGAYVDLTATLWTALDLQHFDAPSGNQLRHLGTTPREYKVQASLSIASTADNVITLRVMKWDDSAASSSVVLDQSRQVNNLVGGRDVAFFNVNINSQLDQNDYIFLQVANQTSTANVTAEAGGYYIIEER